MADKIDKKTAEEIGNLRKIEAEITKELITLRERLKILSSEDVVNLKEASELQFKLLDLEKQKKGITKEIVDINGKVIESDERREELSQSILDLQEDSLDRTQDMLKSNKQLEKEAEKIKIQQSEILNIEKELNRYEVEIQKNKESVGSKGKELLKNSSAQIKLEEYINTTLQSRQDALEKAATQNASQRLENLKFIKLDYQTSVLLSEVQQDMADAAEDAIKGSYKQLDTKREEIGIRNIELDIMDAAAKGDLQAVEFYKKQKEGLEAIISAKQESNELNQKEATKQAEIIERTNKIKGVIAETKFSSVFDGMENKIKMIPGGAVLVKAFGFDKMKDSIQKNLGDSITKISTGLKQGGAEGFKSMISGVKSFGMALVSGPQVVIFGMLAAIGLIAAAFGDVDAAISETQKSLGGTKKEAVAAYDASAKMSKEMKMVGVNAKEVVKNVAMLSEGMGGVDLKKFMTGSGPAAKHVQGMVKDATLLTEKFGLSADEVENVKSLSIMSGKSMATLAGEAIKVAGGVMGTKGAMKVLAGISKDVMVSFKGSTKELIAAAAKAKMLGTNLDAIKQSGMAMLDIESSLGKEMEARVLLGRDINLDAARAAALEGDIPTLQEEILKNAGSLKDFQESGPLKQKALADAMNMSVEEMTKMLVAAEEMEKLGLDKQLQEDLAKATAEEKAAIYEKQAKILEANGDKEAARLAREKASQEESASLSEKMADIFAKLKQSAEKLITPLVEMVHSLLDSEDAGGGLIDAFDGMMTSVKPIFDVLIGVAKILVKGIVPVLKVMWSLTSFILTPLGAIVKMFSGVEDKTKTVTDGVNSVGKATNVAESGFTSILKVVGLIGGAFAAKSLIFKGFDLMKDKAMDVGKTLMSKVGGAASKVAGKVTGKMGGFAGKALGKLTGKSVSAAGGDATSKLLDKQAGNLEKTEKMAGKAQSVGGKIADFGKGLGSAIKSIGKGVGGAFEAILKGLGKGLEGLGQSLATMTPIGPVIVAVAAFFLSLGAALWLAAPAIKAIAPVLMKFADVIGGAFADLIKGLAPVFVAIGEFIKGLIPVLMKIVEVLGNVFIEGIKQIPAIIKSIFEGISGVVKTVGGVIVEVINAIGDNIVKVVDKLMSLGDLDPVKLGAIALGITAIGGALAAFGGGAGAGALMEGLGSLIGGDSPIDQLLQIIEKVDPKTVAAVAAGITSIGAAMKVMADNLSNIDSSKLEEFGDALSGLMKDIGGGALMEGVGKLLGGESPLAQIQNLLSSLEPQKMSLISKSLLSVSSSLKTLADTIAKIDIDKLEQVMSKVGGSDVGSSISKTVGSVVSGITSLFGGNKEETAGAKNATPGKEKLGQDKTSQMASTQSGGFMSGITSLFGGSSEKVSPTQVTTTSVQQTVTKPVTAMAASPIGGGQSAGGKDTKSGPDPVVEKLDRLISIMSSITTQPTIIKIGEKTVEEIQSKIDLRKTYNVAIDNTYGRRV